MPFSIVRNDITKMAVDAIVNAANTSLLGGGGVDGAIHRAAGPQLLAESRTLHGCETGEAKITKGYRLPAKYVIHTVGPVWRGGAHGEQELLSACYRNSLRLAVENGCGSVAFPLISAGAYGYPKDQAMAVAVETISRFLDEQDTSGDLTVYLVVFGREEFSTGKDLYRDIQSYIDDVYVGEHTQERIESRRATLWREDEDSAALFDSHLAPLPSASQMRESTPAMAECADSTSLMADSDWETLLNEVDEGFSEALLRLIDEKGMTDAQCYKRANVDRKLFSKIRSNPAYKPSKATAFAFAIALELSLPEAEALLRKAGFAISHSSKFDIIVEYFLKIRSYDIYKINEVLFQFDMPLLGSVS